MSKKCSTKTSPKASTCSGENASATCKSDIAILLGLYRLGGLYIDCHCGIRDIDGLNALLADAHKWELVLYDKDRTGNQGLPTFHGP